MVAGTEAVAEKAVGGVALVTVAGVMAVEEEVAVAEEVGEEVEEVAEAAVGAAVRAETRVEARARVRAQAIVATVVAKAVVAMMEGREADMRKDAVDTRAEKSK